MRKSRLGRPALPDTKRKTKWLRIRITEAELSELERAAGGMVSTWARQTLLEAARRK